MSRLVERRIFEHTSSRLPRRVLTNADERCSSARSRRFSILYSVLLLICSQCVSFFCAVLGDCSLARNRDSSFISLTTNPFCALHIMTESDCRRKCRRGKSAAVPLCSIVLGFYFSGMTRVSCHIFMPQFRQYSSLHTLHS